MKNIKNIRITIALFAMMMISGFGLNAYSQDDGDKTDTGGSTADTGSAATDANSMFKDFNSMQDYLRSQGVDPYKINWTPIDSMCTAYKFDPDQIRLNKCMYEKARNSFFFAIDKSRCSTSAAGTYPDTLKSQQTTNVSITDKRGNVHNAQETTSPISNTQLDQLRSTTIAQCMQSLNWASADDWTLGKTPPTTAPAPMDEPNTGN